MSIKDSRDDLLHRINELEKENENLRKSELELLDLSTSLQQHNRDLQDFVYITAHDLQEPLHLIRAFGERLNNRYGDSLSEHGRSYLKTIENTSARMQTLIQGLLLYSKVSVEKQNFIDTDLNITVNEVLTDLEVRLEQSDAQVEVGDLPVIVADPLQMRQLFQNLIGNALKFRQEDKPSMVKISCQRLQTGKNGHEYYQICVQDNGIGFDRKYQHRIFNIFQRLHNQDIYEGTGIGLTTCKMIVERHSGTIQATGEPGNGAVFTITLPLFQQQERGERVMQQEHQQILSAEETTSSF